MTLGTRTDQPSTATRAASTATTPGTVAATTANTATADGTAARQAIIADTLALLGELAESSGTAVGPDLTEIGRRAAHLAVFQYTVLPVAEARLSDGTARTEDLRRNARDLARALHWLDRHLTGDARMAGWPTGRMSTHAHQALARYNQAERALVDALAGQLDVREMTELATAYHRAALHAPTRAHSRLRYRGFGGRLSFRLAATIDAVRDGMDNRSAGRHVSARAAQALGDLEARAVASSPRAAVGSPSRPALANL